MERLVLVRHGDYGLDGHLSDTGRQQIVELAEVLADNINGSSMLVLSSTAPRAIDSAMIIAEKFSTTFESHRFLYDEWDNQKLVSLISAHTNQAETVVVVAHVQVELFPKWFGKTHLNVRLPYLTVPKGTGLDIDCRTKEIFRV
ncbi:MAG: histidine phosphatase family protein [Candidatus Staskawiczbacteria bacterium]|nr:histidine phosphatase family protein [Candidatus Staskawiczbacteria bacterium]